MCCFYVDNLLICTYDRQNFSGDRPSFEDPLPPTAPPPKGSAWTAHVCNDWSRKFVGLGVPVNPRVSLPSSPCNALLTKYCWFVLFEGRWLATSYRALPLEPTVWRPSYGPTRIQMLDPPASCVSCTVYAWNSLYINGRNSRTERPKCALEMDTKRSLQRTCEFRT